MALQVASVVYDPKRVLKEFFGFDGFKGNQEAVVNSILSGEDCFVIMPTGAGKSMCYQLPAVMMEGTAIVISPLIALMKNQVDNIRGFAQSSSLAHFLNSSLSKTELTQVTNDILSGETKLLYVAPETLKKDETIDLLKRIKISFVGGFSKLDDLMEGVFDTLCRFWCKIIKNGTKACYFSIQWF